jgi:hypothetical protein
MHGSSFSGDGEGMLRNLDPIYEEVFGGNSSIKKKG